MSYTFLTRPEYYAQLIKFLQRAEPGTRFMLAAMTAVPDHRPEVAALLDAMIEAGQRGVAVSFIIDANAFLLSANGNLPGPLLLHRHLPRQGMAREFQALRDYLDQLDAAGVGTVVLNRPRRLLSSPVHGRCHIKFAVTGDRYYVGSANIEGYDRLDTMLTTEDPKLADWLYGLGERMLSTGHSREAIGRDDLTYPAGPGATFYLDAGEPGRSLILDEALSFIDAARKRITITCQFFPGSVTAQHLQAASRRGVKVEILYNHPSQSGFIGRLGFSAAELLERTRLPAEFFAHSRRGPGYLHTKLIATEQGAMIGSHNFVIQGVNFGTAELALKVLDPEFSREAVAAVKRQLA